MVFRGVIQQAARVSRLGALCEFRWPVYFRIQETVHRDVVQSGESAGLRTNPTYSIEFPSRARMRIRGREVLCGSKETAKQRVESKSKGCSYKPCSAIMMLSRTCEVCASNWPLSDRDFGE